MNALRNLLIPKAGAPPRPDVEAPAQFEGLAGADNTYNGLSERNGNAAMCAVQDWRHFTPRHLIDLVEQHRRHRPETTLLAAIQRGIGRAWSVQ